jgi:thymidine kinase
MHRQRVKGSVVVLMGNMFSGKTSDAIRRLRGYHRQGCKILFVKYAEDDKRLNKGEEGKSQHAMMADETIVGQAVIYTHGGGVHLGERDAPSPPSSSSFPVDTLSVKGRNLRNVIALNPFVEEPEFYDYPTSTGAPNTLPYDVLVIDEAQFYHDLQAFCEITMKNARNRRSPLVLLICGLVSDFDGNKFGCIPDVIHMADQVIQLRAYCYQCGDECAFTGKMELTTATTSDEMEDSAPTVEVIGGEEKGYYPVCRNCRDDWIYMQNVVQGRYA